MSRKDLLIGLQYATQQGIKMREGSEMANKTLNETGLQATKPNQMGGNYIYDPQNPNANLRGQMDPNEVHNREIKVKGEVKQEAGNNPINNRAQAEQRRREEAEAEMRRRSAPDAAINREPPMPSELRKEAYSNRRLDIILETVMNILSEQVKSSEEHISSFITNAKKQGRELTGSERAAIARHRQNIVKREKKINK